MTGFYPDKQIPNNPERIFIKGQKINIEHEGRPKTEHEIINVLDSRKATEVLGLKFNIQNPVPILILSTKIPGRGAAHYSPKFNVILAYSDTTREIMFHEIIHSLEMQKPLPEDLKEFYQKVLQIIPDTANIQPNFHKNIHEFVADAYSKPVIIKLLKQHELYEEFERLTKYIFE